MDARREGKLRKKAPTEYETAPVFFSGSNPDASSKHASVAQQEEALRSDRIYVWVRIPLGVQTGRIHVSSGFFKSEEGARLNKALTDVAERYLAESLKVTDTLMSLLNASVAQLEAAKDLKTCQVWVRIPPEVQIKYGLVTELAYVHHSK